MRGYCGKPDQTNPPKHCPACLQVGKPVSSATLRSLLVPEALVSLGDEAKFHFCSTKRCPIVYFSSEGKTFEAGHLRVSVWQKTDDPNVPVCYCFGWTEACIRLELLQTGKTIAVSSISALVKAGECACEVNNPQGSCCLGNVSQVVKRVSQGRDVPGKGSLQ